MKYLNELLARILNGETAEKILNGLTPQNKGHVGEAMLRILILLGIHPTDSSATVIPYYNDPDTRRLECLSNFSRRLDILQNGLINAGGSNKIDVCWRYDDTLYVCSSKIGKSEIESIADLEIPIMLSEFTESGGYKENGVPIPRSSVKACALVPNKNEVMTLRSKARKRHWSDTIYSHVLGSRVRVSTT